MLIAFLLLHLHQKPAIMKYVIAIILLWSLFAECFAQEVWSVERCIAYAVTHNHDVRLQSFALKDYKIERTKAAGAFLPAIEGNVGGQYNFGRAIDPETNTYTNVNTFYNSYQLSAHLPLFDGLQRYNELRAAKANLLMGKSKLQAQKDATAQRVLQSYIEVLYCRGSVVIAKQKRAESEMLLQQTRVMVEVGTKGEADVAQMEATYATDDYEVTHQQSLYDKALLTLKQLMNYPIEEPLELAPEEEMLAEITPCLPEESEAIYALAKLDNPDIKQAEYSLRSARYAYRASKGALLPSISLGAGVSTTFYKQLNSPNNTSFSQQFKNNAGEYLYATLSVPIFNRLNTLSAIRRQRNNLRRAEEELDYRRNELNRLIKEAVTDQENSRKETEKLKAKVEADSLASHLTTRKYEEGLASSIDVQTGAVTLLQSKAKLLQSKLTYIYKTKMINYYKGEPLWTE